MTETESEQLFFSKAALLNACGVTTRKEYALNRSLRFTRITAQAAVHALQPAAAMLTASSEESTALSVNAVRAVASVKADVQMTH